MPLVCRACQSRAELTPTIGISSLASRYSVTSPIAILVPHETYAACAKRVQSSRESILGGRPRQVDSALHRKSRISYGIKPGKKSAPSSGGTGLTGTFRPLPSTSAYLLKDEASLSRKT